ncbi:MAG: helicase-associated domain-containing protein, partial [Jiangellaceae bacterium]
PVTPAKWAAERGLLWSTYQGTAHMPLEIGLAMRGPEYVLPFTPRPPSLPVATVTPGQVAAVSAASALRLIDRTLAVVESSAADPIPLLKTGRVGARAVTSMAKKTGAAAQEIRLAVELAIRLSLLQPRDLEPPPSTPARGRKTHARGRSKPPAVPPAALVPTDEFKIWRAQSSAARLLTLIEAWWELPIAPLADEKTIRAVLDDDPSRAFAHVRQLTVRLLTGLGGDTRVTDSSALTELVRWYAPMVSGDIVETLVAASMTEAGLLGVVATGAPSDVGRALVANTFVTGLDVDAPALVQAVEGFVANACTTALFGADLTAIVTGPADAELAGVLDRAADRESQGSATTWRFSSATVRRAFDDGADAASLLDELASVAHGDLPQPLVYMINDVARRHGEAWVVDVVCVVVGDDPVLMAEIAAHRKLAKLELHTLAPTVLGSAADSVTTLTALRDAGYAPVRQTANGRVVTRVERLPPATDSAPISSWSHGDDSFDVLQF